MRFYSKVESSPLFQLLKNNNIQIIDDTILTFTDSSWNDCVDTGRSTGGNLSLTQGDAVDYSSHLPVPEAKSSREAEYISVAVACMKTGHLRMLVYDLRYMGIKSYDGDNLKYEPSRIIVDNEAAVSMVRCNKDTACFWMDRYQESVGRYFDKIFKCHHFLSIMVGYTTWMLNFSCLI